MGIKFYCPSCDKRLNVKSFLAGKGGFCPHCQARIQIPLESEPKRPSAADSGASTVSSQQPSANPAQVTPAAQGPSVSAPSRNGHAPAAHGAVPVMFTHAAVASSGPLSPQGAPGAAYSGAPQTTGAPQAGQASVASPAPVYGAYGAAAQPAMAAPVTAPVTPAVPVKPVAAASPALVDPIAEAPQAVWYVRPPAGGQYGPAVGEIMRKWMAEGRVSADSLVWREGWPDWRKAGKVFPSLGATPAVAASAAAVAPLPGVPTTAAPRRNVRIPRKRDSTTLAIAVIVFLVLMTIGLLGGLLWVLGIV